VKCKTHPSGQEDVSTDQHCFSISADTAILTQCPPCLLGAAEQCPRAPSSDIHFIRYIMYISEKLGGGPKLDFKALFLSYWRRFFAQHARLVRGCIVFSAALEKSCAYGHVQDATGKLYSLCKKGPIRHAFIGMLSNHVCDCVRWILL